MRPYLLVPALTVVLFASPAVASPVNCALNVTACSDLQSGITGTGAWTLFGTTQTTWMDLSNPHSLFVDSTSAGQWHSIGDASLATGTLKILADSFSTLAVQAFSQLTSRDVFTLAGPGGGPVQITARFRADGAANLPNQGGALGPGGNATVELFTPGGPAGDSFSRGLGQVPYVGAVSSDTNGTPYLEALVSFDVTPGTPFALSYRLTAQSRNLSSIDMMNTATLAFTLPAGYSITSIGGYGTQTTPTPTPTPDPSPVPEPSTWTLMALGTLLMARQVRKRIRR
jgi:hypothetical protein